jgi:peptidylprolyl isomerase
LPKNSSDRRKQQRTRYRTSAAAARARQHQRRRRGIVTGSVAVAIVILFVVVMIGPGLGSKNTSATTPTTASTTSTSVAPLKSAAGKPCVATKGALPKGAPAVPVQTGPPPTKLVIKDLKVGTGAVVKAGQTLSVDDIGVACSTGAIFDSSYSRGIASPIDLNSVIPGWQQGIPGMKVGGERLLGIPSALAYSTAGSPPAIAPDEALWFVVVVHSAK